MRRLEWLRLVEKTNLAGYKVGEDGSDGCQVCFVLQEYASGKTGRQLDGSLVRITDVFHHDSENRSMRELFHRNCDYTNARLLTWRLLTRIESDLKYI